MISRFEAAAEDYRKLLDQECVASTSRKSPTRLVSDENTSTSPLKQVGKAETDQHILGFMADQVSGTIWSPPLSLSLSFPVIYSVQNFCLLACWTSG
jgi:hypothetical protein